MKKTINKNKEELLKGYSIFMTILFIVVGVYGIVVSEMASDLTEVVKSKDTELSELKTSISSYRIRCESSENYYEQLENKLKQCELTLAQNGNPE